MLRRTRIIVLGAALSAMGVGGVASINLASPAYGAADEAKKLAPDEIPQPVKRAAMGRLPGAKITSAEKENENGNVVFDLELKHEGLKYEMDVKEDGTILEIEKQIKNPPAAITRAVEAKYPGAKVKEVMEVNKVNGKQETPEQYEIVISTGQGKDKEVIVSLDGSSVKEEAEEGDKKD